MEKGVPKTMYKAVPAGSVYFYETSENLEVVKERLFGKPISDKMPEQGFGIAYVGVW
jgi:CRISPR/Cas system CMR-associated protein Cmr3 (group 5 of RAMP superfamily)